MPCLIVIICCFVLVLSAGAAVHETPSLNTGQAKRSEQEYRKPKSSVNEVNT